MRDRWASYDCYACAMRICVAHLLRELTHVEEQEHQEWAGEMTAVLLGMHAAAQEWRKQGASTLPTLERDEWVAQYFEVLAQGFAAQPAPAPEQVPRRSRRCKQTPAKNLLDDSLRRADLVLADLVDLSLPFTNNQAERDLRMIPRPAEDLGDLSQRSRADRRLTASAALSPRCANKAIQCSLP